MRGQQNISMCVILIYKILSKLHLYKIETFFVSFLINKFWVFIQLYILSGLKFKHISIETCEIPRNLVPGTRNTQRKIKNPLDCLGLDYMGRHKP